MKTQAVEYKGVEGKTVEKILFTDSNGQPDIEIRFSDGISLHFGMQPAVMLEPEIWSWRGDGRVVKRFPAVTTKAA
jgi:hypothetical protein